MNAYRLDPVADHRTNEHWSLSTIPPVTCWVLADCDAHARELVTQATVIASRRGAVTRDSPVQPWMSDELVRCTTDESRNVAPGTIETAAGALLMTQNA